MKKSLILLLVILFVGIVAGCNKEDSNDPLETLEQRRLIQSFYPNEIWKVDRLEMLRSDGQRKYTEDITIILQWLYKVGKLEVTIDPAPEDRSGTAYGIGLYHENEEKAIIRFSPISVADTHILVSKELVDEMDVLWEIEELLERK